MKRSRGLAVLLVLVSVGLAAGPASAKAKKTDEKKYCTAVVAFSTDISNGTTTTKQEASKIQKGLQTASKAATGSLKTATDNLADFYGKIAKGTAYAAALKSLGTKYSSAAAAFGAYVGTHCLSYFLQNSLTTSTTPSTGTVGLATTTTVASGSSTTVVGTAAACAADRALLDAAELAYNLINRHYTDMATLVSSGLLPSASTLHTIRLTGNATNATAYAIDGC